MLRTVLIVFYICLATFSSLGQNPDILIYDSLNTPLKYFSPNPPYGVGDAMQDFQSTIDFDKQCRLYIGSEGGGLCIYDGLDWEQLTRENTGTLINSDFINAVFVQENGVIWVGNAGLGGVVRISPEDTVQFNAANTNGGLPIHVFVTSFTEDSAGNIWVGTDGGIGVFDGTNWTSYTDTNGLPDNAVKAVAYDPIQDAIWVGTTFGGLAYFKGATWTIIDKSNSNLLTNNISSIVVDDTGTIWAGLFLSKLAKRVNDTTWIFYGAPDLPQDNVTCLTIDQIGVLWVGTGSGIGIFDGTNWGSVTIKDSLPHNWIRSIAVDPLNNICIATEEGLAIYNKNQVKFCLNVSNDNICFGETQGSATVAPHFGSDTYDVLWDDPASQTSPTATGLTAGIYNVTVTDNGGSDSGYVAFTSTQIIAATTAIISNISIVDSPTYSGSDGSLDLTVSGGDPPYSFLWSNGATSEDVSNLAKGAYSVTVTDAIGCTSTTSIDMPSGFPLYNAIDGLLYSYPNPFRRHTNIVLLAPAAGDYSLHLYNLNGELRASILDKRYLSAGRHVFKLSWQDAPGFYYLQLYSATMIATRKLIRIK